MLSRTVVVTGASRGLGLELVKQLVKNPEKHPNRNPSHVVATCRNPDNAPELMELAAEEKDRLFVKARNVAFGGECSLEIGTCRPLFSNRKVCSAIGFETRN